MKKYRITITKTIASIAVMALAPLALALCACASSGSASNGAAGNSWVSLPRSGTLVIYGASGTMNKRETEIDVAREDAARKAAMYHSVWASYVSMQNIAGSIFDYYADSEITLDYDSDLEKYMDRLSFNEKRDITNIDRGVVIRFTYPASFPGTVRYNSARNANGRPEWTTRPPGEIGGFMAGVGYSGRQVYLRDTFEKSCDAAVAALVSQLSTIVTTRGTSVDGQNTSVIRQRSTGRLDNFLVLEVWMDSATGAVWTLAIARKPN